MAYKIALFVHITGAVILFIGMGVEWLGMTRLRQAQRVEQVREVLGMMHLLNKLFPISSLLILAGGLYMTITVWGFGLAWLDAALVAVLATAFLGPFVGKQRMAPLAQEAFSLPDGPVSASLHAKTHDPMLLFWSRIVALLGWWILFLMSVKPGLEGTLIGMVVATALGIYLAKMTQRARGAAVPASTRPAASSGTEVSQLAGQ